MDNLGRFLLRFILVPFGYLAAVIAGTLVIVFGSWKLGQPWIPTNPDEPPFAMLGALFAAPVLLVTLISMMWLPAAIGILISEGFAIRSWIFHALNGAVTAWIGWSLFGYIDDTQVAINDPLAVTAAGIAGGFAYWLIAGWSAGFWKPVFRRSDAILLPAERAMKDRPEVR
jgi:hypothetical protein